MGDDNDKKIFNVGLANIGFDTNEKSRYPSNDMILQEDEKEEYYEKEYTKDGRDRNKFSIVFKPDETKYPNPDETGNGIDTTPEIGSREDINDTRVGYGDDTTYYSKSLIGQLYDTTSEIRSELKNLMSYFYREGTLEIDHIVLKTTETIYKNIVNNEAKSSKKNVYTSGSKLSFVNIDLNTLFNFYVSYLDTLKSLNFNNPDITLTPKQDKSLFNNKTTVDDILKALKIERREELTISETFNSWFQINKTIETLDLIYNKYKEFKISRYTYYNQKIMKNQIKTMTKEQSDNMTLITKRLYITCILLLKTLFEIRYSLTGFFYQITPKNNFNIYVDNTKLVYKVDKLNPYISSDYHLLKEYIKVKDDNYEFSKKVILMHNEIVKPTDLFLFLGDLSESEIFTQNISKAQKELIELCHLLHGKKIIITGNNDVCPDEFLKKCGFIEIYRDPILLKTMSFSHGPIITKPGILNIHGHIHGNKEYWVDCEDHVDAFYGLWGGPVKLNFLTNPKTVKEYQSGCKTRADKLYSDPESLKVPGNLI